MTTPETPVVADRAPTGDQWWAVDPLLLLPCGGKVRLMSPLADKRLIVPVDIAQLLLMAQGGVPRVTGTPPLGWGVKKYTEVTTTLAARGYLVDSPEPGEVDGPWQHWGPVAWAYHDMVSQPSAAMTDTSGPGPETTRPSSFRQMRGDQILLLPRVASRIDKGFIEVVEERRTHRDFRPESIGTGPLSDILRYSFGPLRFADAGPLGIVQLRAAASGGARHETEAYVYVFDVDGVSAGLYAYDGLLHGLVPLRQGMLRDEAEWLTLEQGFFRNAAFGVITVALSDRMSWKYHNAGAYRIMWQDTGHVAQVFSMMCAALDLGASMTGAIRVPDARRCLGLDSASELVTFALACGHPCLTSQGLPVSVNLPPAPFTLGNG